MIKVQIGPPHIDYFKISNSKFQFAKIINPYAIADVIGINRNKLHTIKPELLTLVKAIITNYRSGIYGGNILITNCKILEPELFEMLTYIPHIKEEVSANIIETKRMLVESYNITNHKELKEKLKQDSSLSNQLSDIDKFYIQNTNNTDFYKSSEWKKLRETILNRDGYMCGVCKLHYGKSSEATDIHHIQLLSLRPDLATEPSNLISLCGDCHLRAHNHIDHDLSKLGYALQEANQQAYPKNYVPPFV